MNYLDFEEEKTEIELLVKFTQLFNLFDEIDAILDELPAKQSNNELLRSDLEHLIEDKEMGSIGYKNIAKALERVRIQRRHLKKAYFLSKTFNDNIAKIVYKEQRPFIKNEIEKCYKSLQTTYHYRLLSAENINDLIGKDLKEENQTKNDTVTRINPRDVTKEMYTKLIDEGLNQTQIAMKLGFSPSSITSLKRKFGFEMRKTQSKNSQGGIGNGNEND